MTLLEILQRAEELSQKTIAGSITPEEVGGLIEALALQMQNAERDGAILGIRKVYLTREAMQADTNPTSTSGKPLRRGNLVAIYDEATSSTDPNSGLVSMWTGTGWQAVARIGTAMRHENTAIEQRLTLIEGDIRDVVKLELGELEQRLISEIALRASQYKDQAERVAALEAGSATTAALEAERQAREAEDARLSRLMSQQAELRSTDIARLEDALQVERTQRSELAERLRASQAKGGGYYNVTSLHPLSEGYYTLETALAAIVSAGVPRAQRKGMIMTIEVRSGAWEDYRYTGDATDDQFASPALWQAHTSIKGVRISGQLREPIGGIIELPDTTVEVASSVDESTRPVSSAAVKAELDRLKVLSLDADTEPTDEGTQVTLSQEGRRVAQFTVAGGGGSGEGTATKAKVTAELSAKRIKLGDSALLAYGYTHYTDGEQDGLPATLTLVINRGVQLIVRESLGVKQSGESGTIDLGKYITSADSYSIKIEASYQEGDTAKTRVASALLSVVDLSISLYNRAEIESYLGAGGYRDGDTLSVSLVVRGGAKAIAMYLDGERTPAETKAITGAGSRQTFILPARALRPGGHSLQFVAQLDEIVSNSIYLDVLKAGADEPWVGLLCSHPLGVIHHDGVPPRLYAAQYEQTEWHYIAIDRVGQGVSSLSLEEAGKTREFVAPRTYQRHTAYYMSRGTIDCTYRLGTYRKGFVVDVAASRLEGLGIKPGAAVELLARGRSNAEANPAQWTSGEVHTSFQGVDWRSSGWTGDALRLLNGASATIGYTPFGTDAKTTGLTLLIELRATNVRQHGVPIVSCFDTQAHSSGDFGGIQISSERIAMPTGGSVSFRTEDGEEVSRDLGLDMQYASGEYYHLALVVHPQSDERTVRLYINGVLSKADTYQDTVFRQRTPQAILLDSTGADLEIKQLRIYKTALTDDEVLSAYITERPSIDEMQFLRERNDVLDPQTGDISWTKLYQRRSPVLSITLEDGGLERLWGKSTDTKTNYKLRELILRSPYGRAYDLKVTDAAIRRQGTSTSTYPIKNLRIYLQRKGFDTKVYRNTGTDSEDVWELVPSRTYTMRPDTKPMSIINLKADYADSSMCYNTGGALLLDHLLRANPSLKTPGMMADELARFGIDGMPIDVFTADTIQGAKRYVGQFQFNNDKSKSGYLFGQTKQDGTEIALEFINNTNPVANFAVQGDVATQLASAGTDGFDASVEFLYPEKDYLWNGKKGQEDTAPENIKQAVIRLWQWVKDCLPDDADPGSMSSEQVLKHFQSTKFRAEIAQYFSPQNLALWWVWTDYTMAVDQRVKNTFFRTWDGRIWYLTYYDGDTAMGKRNDAFLAYLYNISRDTWDPQRSKYAFEGRASRLWALVLANMQQQIKDAAQTLRTTLTDAVFRRVYNQQIMRAWSERQYNKSGINKYIKPTHTDYNGGGLMNYIFALNGTMYPYRNQLIDRRFSLLDARYEVGAYHSDAVQGYIGKGTTPTQIRATAGDEYYFGWRTQNGQFRQHQRVLPGGVAVFDFDAALSQNDPVRLVGASRMLKLDFASTAPYLQGAWNLNGCSILEELIAPLTSGHGTQWYPLLSKITGLRRIDLTGQSGITGTEDEQARTFDVSSHSGLQELKLRGTSVRSVRLAPGSPLIRLELPAGLAHLSLKALPKLTESGLSLERWEDVRSLELAACPGIQWVSLVERCTGLERLRVEGVDMTDDGTMLRRLSSIKGLDANGAGVETCSLVGRCQLTRYIPDEEYDRYQAHFPELTIRQALYTVIELDETVVASANMSNLDNQTGYKFDNQYQPSAHLKKIVRGIHRVLGKQGEKGVMSIIQLHDQDSTRYADKLRSAEASEATVDGSQGDVWTYFPEYYYKGINDILGKKKYAVYSTDPNPDRPEGRKITGAELRSFETLGKQTYTLGNSLIDCVKEQTTSTDYINACSSIIAKIPCRGYRRASVPMSVGFLGVGLIFFSNSDAKIDSVMIDNGAEDYISGMNVIVNIPDQAEYLITCYPSYIRQDAYVWLTNSDNPADWEPDWVHSQACLIQTLPPTLTNGRLVSKVNTGNLSVTHSEYFSVQKAQVEARGHKVLDYERLKNWLNLWFFNHGTRAPYRLDDVFHHRYTSASLDALKVGIKQPQKTGHEHGTIIREGILYKYLWSLNMLGVANMNNSVKVTLDGLSTTDKFSNRSGAATPRFGSEYGWVQTYFDQATNRCVLERHDRYYANARFSLFGKYMDIFRTNTHLANYDVALGQGSLIYSNSDTGPNHRLYFGRGVDGWGINMRLCMDTWGQPGDEVQGHWHGVRAMYLGKIVNIATKEEYEQIQNNH